MVSLLATTTTSTAATGTLLLIGIIAYIFYCVVMWRVYAKSEQPGWAAIIPIYNIYVLLKIIGRPAWWLVLLVIPFVSLITVIVVYIDLAKSFGKNALYGLCLLILSIIFLPILAFGSSRYVGPRGAAIARY